jgi:galactitol-specific phosphotransferase system IIB component
VSVLRCVLWLCGCGIGSSSAVMMLVARLWGGEGRG